MRLHWLLLVLAPACDAPSENPPCPELEVLRADDERVGGTTVDELIAAMSTASRTTPPVELVWFDELATTATVNVVGMAGTGYFDQRRDCVPECPIDLSLLMACPPDGLRIAFRGSISTADGRLLGEHFSGHARASATLDELSWRVVADLAERDLRGSLDPLAVHPQSGHDPQVRVHVSGVGEQVRSVDVELVVTREIAGEDHQVYSMLGSTPRP
jgi:hypothetical protein